MPRQPEDAPFIFNPLPRQTTARRALSVLGQGGGYVGVKAYTSFREGNRFLTLLYSAENGRLLALIESDYLGMIRTGAASGVATKYLARDDADVLASFGTGWQSRGQVLAVAAVRPLKQVRVYSRDAANRQKFLEALAGQIERLTKEFNRLAPLEIVADPSVSAGGCRLETQFGVIDQQFESQLARLREELL